VIERRNLNVLKWIVLPLSCLRCYARRLCPCSQNVFHCLRLTFMWSCGLEVESAFNTVTLEPIDAGLLIWDFLSLYSRGDEMHLPYLQVWFDDAWGRPWSVLTAFRLAGTSACSGLACSPGSYGIIGEARLAINAKHAQYMSRVHALTHRPETLSSIGAETYVSIDGAHIFSTCSLAMMMVLFYVSDVLWSVCVWGRGKPVIRLNLLAMPWRILLHSCR
jgi:hypothetical protein